MYDIKDIITVILFNKILWSSDLSLDKPVASRMNGYVYTVLCILYCVHCTVYTIHAYTNWIENQHDLTCLFTGIKHWVSLTMTMLCSIPIVKLSPLSDRWQSPDLSSHLLESVTHWFTLTLLSRGLTANKSPQHSKWEAVFRVNMFRKRLITDGASFQWSRQDLVSCPVFLKCDRGQTAAPGTCVV